ncbi:MAG: HEAT repeat domain-containing protein [Candidatus Lokiarchaeota archaeon]|nr:HEAT repeat domain-containing protein [Candidatus Lokiarchaeota archaeon]
MSRELKDLIDSIDSANQAHSDLETMIRYLKEEVQRLNFTVSEQKKIIQNQKLKASNINIPEDITVLKDLVTEQRQDLIKKDKDIEILQQTITDVSSELENIQKFDGENKELIYANKEIVQLTEENEVYRKQIDDLLNAIKELQSGRDNTTIKVGEETSELIEAKKLIIKLTEENGINRVQIESSRHEIEELRKKEQESEALKIQYLHELNEVNKILDQLTFDNDQYHEKVNYLQQKLEETVKLKEEQFKEVEESTNYEETNQKLFDLEIENNELKNIINTNITIIENLKQRNQDVENKLEEKAKIEDQKLDDLRQKALEKDEELNSTNLKLQKIENANKQLSDLIVELKVLEDTIEDRVELVTIPKQTVFENYPPTLFFRMYKLLSNDYKTSIVDLLIEDLKSTNRDSRTYAIKVLSAIKGPKVFDELKELVKDDDWIVKLYLIKALRNFEYSETTDLLKILQVDGDPDVREAAIEMLSKLNIH